MLLFSWLAAEYSLQEVSYWPGLATLAMIAAFSTLSYWLTVGVSCHGGSWLNNRLNLLEAETLVFRCIVLLLQTPVILLYSVRLGGQLP